MNRSIDGCFITHNGIKHFLKEYSNFHVPVFSADISSIFLQYIIKQIVKGNFFFRRYYVACQITNICKHFTAPEHFSVHRDSKMQKLAIIVQCGLSMRSVSIHALFCFGRLIHTLFTALTGYGSTKTKKGYRLRRH